MKSEEVEKLIKEKTHRELTRLALYPTKVENLKSYKVTWKYNKKREITEFKVKAKTKDKMIITFTLEIKDVQDSALGTEE